MGKVISYLQHIFLLVVYLFQFVVYFLHVYIWFCRQKQLQNSNELMTNNYQVSNTQLHIQEIWLNRSRKETIRLKQVSYSVMKPQNIITDSIKNTI